MDVWERRTRRVGLGMGEGEMIPGGPFLFSKLSLFYFHSAFLFKSEENPSRGSEQAQIGMRLERGKERHKR